MDGELTGLTLGNYRLEELIGRGAVGEVYLARNTLVGKRVALKVLKREMACDAEIMGRFYQEARAVNAIDHPNIVDIIDYGNSGEHYFFAMEYLEGETLARRMERTGISIEEGRRILQQCANALGASHRAGIVHRDLKPENIFLTRRGVKLLDFGVAKLMQPTAGTVKTSPGQTYGTPHYMSPDQIRGLADLDGRSDIYSLGVIMYEVWTGQNPFERATAIASLQAHLEEDPPALRERNPHLSPTLESICLLSLHKDRNKRFRTMEELEFALEQPQRWAERRRQELGQPTDVEATRYQRREAITVNVMKTGPGRPAMITLSRRLPFPKPYLYAGGAAVLVAPLVIWWALRAPAKVIVVSSPPVAAVAAPELVRTRVVSIPPGATVLDGDHLLGTTPLDIEKPAGAKLDLQVKLDQYEGGRREYVVNAPREIEFTLQKLAVAGKKRPAAAKAAKAVEKPLDEEGMGLLPAKF
jgi:tRNA A-37 threonylcarbamoyl transferase component Bud32